MSVSDEAGLARKSIVRFFCILGWVSNTYTTRCTHHYRSRRINELMLGYDDAI